MAQKRRKKKKREREKPWQIDVQIAKHITNQFRKIENNIEMRMKKIFGVNYPHSGYFLLNGMILNDLRFSHF